MCDNSFSKKYLHIHFEKKKSVARVFASVFTNWKLFDGCENYGYYYKVDMFGSDGDGGGSGSGNGSGNKLLFIWSEKK